MRGPPPTPTKILEARGSWRAAKRQNEPRPPVVVLACPEMLDQVGRDEWRRQCHELAELGLLTELDRAALCIYCEAWSEYVLLTERIRELVDADVFSGYALAIQQGLLNAKARAADRVLKVAAQFGFTPAARARLAMPDKPKEGDGGKSRFFAPVPRN